MSTKEVMSKTLALARSQHNNYRAAQAERAGAEYAAIMVDGLGSTTANPDWLEALLAGAFEDGYKQGAAA